MSLTAEKISKGVEQGLTLKKEGLCELFEKMNYFVSFYC